MKKLTMTIVLLTILSGCTSGNSMQSELNKLKQENADLKTQVETLRQNQPQKILCKDEPEGTPVITSLSTDSGSVGSTILINGCNFSGFEGDKLAWIEDQRGTRGIMYSESGSTDKQLKVALKEQLCQRDNSYSGMPCDAYLKLVPGKYKIYVNPWGKMSDMIEFTIR